VSLVSKQFRQLCEFKGFFKMIEVNPVFHTQAALQFLSKATMLRHVILSASRVFKAKHKWSKTYVASCDQMLLELSRLQHLRTLQIADFQLRVSRSCLEDLAKSDWWTKIVGLSLTLKKDSKEMKASASTALTLLASCGSIQYLSICGLSRVEEEKLLMSCRGLRCFMLDNCHKQSKIAAILKKFQETIEIVQLGGNYWGESLNVIIEKCSNLECISQDAGDLPFTSADYQPANDEEEDSEEEFWNPANVGNLNIEIANIELVNFGVVNVEIANVGVDFMLTPLHVMTKLSHLRKVYLTLVDDVILNGYNFKGCLSHLRKLEILVRKRSKDLLKSLATACPNLHLLHFKSLDVVQEIDEQIKAVSKNCKKLDIFIVEAQSVEEFEFKEESVLTDICKSLPKLKNLSLNLGLQCEKVLFKNAKTMLNNSRNLRAIGTKESLFIKNIVSKKELYKLKARREEWVYGKPFKTIYTERVNPEFN
jgi:hypothetical protein